MNVKSKILFSFVLIFLTFFVIIGFLSQEIKINFSGATIFAVSFYLFVLGCLLIYLFFAISKLQEQANDAQRAKNDFTSLASHQLRTPLSSVNWYAEMLLSGDAGPLNEEQRNYLEEIFNGNQRMIEVVDALLYVDVGSFSIDAKPLNPSEIADGVLIEYARQISRKKINVEKKYGQEIFQIESDPRLIWIVMQNLISNSIKYTPEGGKITIEIKKEDHSVVFGVADSGYGIPKNQQAKIFTRLFRAENVIQRSEGTGLGLYLAKSAVEQAGGTIWFESEENKGTKFSFRVPFKDAAKKEKIAK